MLGPGGQPQTEQVEDLPASERFFAGGDTTVRGFALDRLGEPGTIDKDGFPKGGNALMVLNGEIRTPVWRVRALSTASSGCGKRGIASALRCR